MSVLALKDVSYKYEGTTRVIFKDVNLTFEPGKVYTIVGKSGSGKSTLLSLLSGLDTATSGKVEIGGESLASINRNHYRRKKAGIIFQSLNLLPNATAIDNIVLSMNISGVTGIDKKARALELLEKVGISQEKANRKIVKLSGGEQQRIGIARALAHNPELIIADEPTGSLDKDTEVKVLKIFRSLAQEEGKCVIIVTHSKKVTTIADEIWGLEKGSFRQLDPSEVQAGREIIAKKGRKLV
ncbi:MAG: ATP-binding cassette domain-containing protein [Defluviitaleaceae bacterium]|nr:ATP-binding cassette domain-containing protein [Defluviitaleaceae bacterium]